MNSSRQSYPCRFCAEKKLLKDLINLENNPTFIQNCLQKLKYLKIECIDISSNNLPQFICEACNDALSHAYNFIIKVKGAQTIFNYLPKIKYEIFEGNVTSIKAERLDDSSSSEGVTDMNISQKSGLCSNKKSEYSLVNKLPDLKKALEDLLLQHNFDKQNQIYIFDFINNEILIIKADGLKGKSFVQKISCETSMHTQSIKSEENMHTYTEVPIINFVTQSKSNKSTNIETNEQIEDVLIDFPEYSDDSAYPSLNDEDKLFETDNNGDSSTVNPLSISTSTTTLENNIDSQKLKTRKQSMKATKSKDTAKTPNRSLLINQYISTNNQITMVNDSWSDYMWLCQHCDTKCDSIEDLREHSKLLHDKCCGYKCADCPEPFITFTAFVEHVRQHRPRLR